MIPVSPRNQSCAAASRLALATRNSFYAPGCRFSRTDGQAGVSKRIEYGSVGCVPPVAWFPCAGGMFVGLRRVSNSGFGKVSSSRRRAAARAHHHHHHHITALPSPPLRASDGHGRRYRAVARASLRTKRAMSPAARFRLLECGRRGAPLHRRQSHRPRPPVVRALHEHGAAALRPARHRLGHGALVCAATASACPARRSAPSR